MNATVGLTKRIMAMPYPWNIWVALLGFANVLGGLVFWNTVHGKSAIAAMAVAFVVMVAIYARFGFVRLLGLGHIVAWIPLLLLFFRSVIVYEPGSLFYNWLLVVLFLNGASLVIDIVDVIRYLNGERAPMQTA